MKQISMFWECESSKRDSAVVKVDCAYINEDIAIIIRHIWNVKN